MNDELNLQTSVEVGDPAASADRLYASETERHLQEIERWAVDHLKPFVDETDANAVDSHILDLGEGVRIYRLKANCPETVEVALDAIQKCKFIEAQAKVVPLDTNGQALFDLGRIYQRLVGVRGTIRATSPARAATKTRKKMAASPSNSALRQLKRRAAEEAISNALNQDPACDEKQAIMQAANELNVSPRTLRKWRQMD